MTRRIVVFIVILAAVLVFAAMVAGPASAAGKPVPRKVNLCQAAALHGTYRWQCQHPTLRPSAWDLARWR